ncbi:MAG: ABC transporter ATP-binding protein [Pseudomonadota bacterium]
MGLAIETRGLTRHFGSVRAVDGINLQVPQGSVFGFLGPNGSGKTTTIRLLLDLIGADSGTVRLNGTSLSGARRAALSGVGAIVETPALYPNLTGQELLRVAALLLGQPRREIDRALDIVGLRDAALRRVGEYSLGMRQRLALARALMGRPRLLILDEPTNGLDPAGIADMRQLIMRLPEQTGTTIFVSSHQLSEMEQMTDHCALIRKGRLIYQGRRDALMQQAPSVIAIETDQTDKALALAQQRRLDAAIDGPTLLIRTPLERSERAELIRALVTADCAVSAVTLRATSLEALFLSLMRDAPMEATA